MQNGTIGSGRWPWSGEAKSTGLDRIVRSTLDRKLPIRDLDIEATRRRPAVSTDTARAVWSCCRILRGGFQESSGKYPACRKQREASGLYPRSLLVHGGGEWNWASMSGKVLVASIHHGSSLLYWRRAWSNRQMKETHAVLYVQEVGR